jgi:hypothetical protein
VGRPHWREDGSVYNYCRPSPAQSFSSQSPAGCKTVFYCVRFETPPTWRSRSPYFYYPKNRVAQLYPEASGSLSPPPMTHRATVEVFETASTWVTLNSKSLKSKLCYERRSVGQSVLEKSTHLELTTRLLLLSDNCGFVDVRRSLWREDGFAPYNCCWSSPAQSFPGPRPAAFVTIVYCIRFETPPSWRARNSVAQLYLQALGSLFVASYDSQGYGEGIRPRLHAGHSWLWNGWML